ncbi:NAD(P)H-dependent oxidoreductase subunit E [Eubacteriales bacterium OttesenSCG-928-K08]|nr:NAD(P)H-dependent oxidoreductase subunit E [Eubacteriales bacterium OttesenSCG-928-K08]
MTEEILSLITKYPKELRYALAAMQDMQRQFKHVPREGIELLAQHIGCKTAQLYSMATFYKALSLDAKGKHIIKLCDGTACHIRGANQLIDGIERLLGIAPGETSQDGLFSLELVNCLGSCAIAPVMVVDETYYSKVTLEKLPEIIDAYREVTP